MRATTLRPVRVLVVDDERDFAEALVTRLTRRGYSAAAAFSGPSALVSLGHDPVDVVVLDLKMPGMDGLEVLRQIRHLDPDIRVLVLTGHATVSAGIDGMRLGAADFLQKPVGIELLCTAIDAAAARGAGRTSEKEEKK
ncbi:MAG: response regulator [Acidobacteriota bacterium]